MNTSRIADVATVATRFCCGPLKLDNHTLSLNLCRHLSTLLGDGGHAMLEFDDIQHILLTRAPALTGRYEFLSFRSAGGGRGWRPSWKRCSRPQRCGLRSTRRIAG